tara:strand:- start:2302 stop:2535 length:234 start_codon:yes stop_codon:yes gene_type:complete
MELIESFTKTDADLGSQFITEKEITLKFSGDELRLLNNIMELGEMTRKGNFRNEDEQQAINELLGHILEGVSEYTLV